MHDRRQALSVIGATVAGATASFYPMTRPKADAAKLLAFGGSIPMSGKEGDTGLLVLEGYRVAAKYVNEELGGVKIGDQLYKLELKIFDDASDPQRATTLVQKLVDDGTNFFLGSFSSSIILPTATITERAQRPMVQTGGGSDQIFTRNFRYMFGMYPRASRQLLPLAAMIKSMADRVKTVSFLIVNDSYSKSQADGALEALKDSNVKVLDVYKIPVNTSDLSGVLSSIRAQTPDALICNTHQQESQLLIQQLAATGTDVKLIFTALGPETPSFRTNLGKLADGLTFLQYRERRNKFRDPFFGSSDNFYAYYDKNSDRKSSYQTASGAACIITYLKAMQDAKSVDPKAVRDALASVDFTSVYGPVKFTADGDGDPLLMGPAVGQLQNGNGEFVFPASVATAPLKFPLDTWSGR